LRRRPTDYSEYLTLVPLVDRNRYKNQQKILSSEKGREVSPDFVANRLTTRCVQKLHRGERKATIEPLRASRGY
jgi:hypothetical protein